MQPDVVLVTHLHQPHWDAAAAARLSAELPLLCQEGNGEVLAAQGFTDVTEISGTYSFRGVTLTRTGGRHGTGEIGAMMGRVSGFVFHKAGEPSLYVAGDTIWCDEVQEVLDPVCTRSNDGECRRGAVCNRKPYYNG